MNDERFVLVTGASSGIGRATAIRLAGKGYRVFATVRNDADARALENASPAGAAPIRAIRMDVTDSQSIAAAKDMIDSVAGGAGLFGLVNNAGICVVGPVECLNISEWKNQFDVNFFGLIAVTQAMLPLLRRYSQTHRSSIPRIVNISSVTGTVPTPLFGAYCASKAAVESISDTLRRELHEHNIGVGMIIPGTIQTEIWRKEKAGAEAIAARPDCRGLYSRLIDHVAAYVFRTAEKAKPAENVAIAIERALKRKTPPIRTLVAWESHVGVNVRRFMPDRIFDFLMLRTFGLNGTQEKITAESGDHRDELTHDPFVR